MPQKTNLKQKGLVTDPNQLSQMPEGAMVAADNVIIDRDNVVMSRRGFAQYGNTFGLADQRAKQFLVYKNRILAHYNDVLLFNANPHNNIVDGNFEPFAGSYLETEPGRRIRAFESNKNLYFTTSDGIKKISARTADDFTTAVGFIRDAGAAKALDVTGTLNSQTSGFLPPNSKVAYRVVWSYKDRNENLIVGSPSSRLVISNYSAFTANVDLQFAIPELVTPDYFYQVYRSAVFTATGSLTLADIDPGDELQLVIEDYPTAAQLAAGIINVTDIAPEEFRKGGLPLYTNPTSGDGIGQANEPPPKAKDITMYQSTLFYANTETRANTTITLLSVENLISGTSTITITPVNGVAQTYTFTGSKELTKFDFTSYVGAIPAALDGKYFLLNSSSNKHKYYVWFDNSKSHQLIDFSFYVGTIPSDLASTYFLLYTPDPTRTYYVWFDSNGSNVDPGTDPNNNLVGKLGIRVVLTGLTTKAQVANAVQTAIATNDVQDDFDVVYVGGASSLTVDSKAFVASNLIVENVKKGFQYTISTDSNVDPGNNLGVHTDVVGRQPFRINVSRNITTKPQIAALLASEIVKQDNAVDFTIAYTGGASFIQIQNNNNGNTDDAVDSGISPIANGFVITVLAQGTGEDSLTQKVLLSGAATPGLQIDETARSLVNVINKNTNESVYAYYVSGTSDLPGMIVLEVKDIGVNGFTVTANNAATGAEFNPALPPVTDALAVQGKAELKPNRIYFAKLQQPEAVPLLNFLDVGPQDKAISRILALRESLFILKEDGVYRLTGTNGAYSVSLFDESTKIIAPDSAVVLNNQIYCLSNLGIVNISDTGVSIISKPIYSDIKLLSSSNYNFKFTTFGVSYENDFSYLLWMPSSVADTVATIAYRYNTVTQTWTLFDLAKTCGIVNPGDDKLYLGPSDINFVERERKLFNRTDFADRNFDLIIPSNSVNDKILRLSSSVRISVGDAVVQTQYLTLSEYNQLLRKLDLDPSIGQAETTKFDFSTYIGSIPEALHSKYFVLYAASDSRKYAVFYDAHGDLPALDTNVFNDIIDATQIRVDISSGVTTKADLALATKTAIQSRTFDFIVSYIGGQEFFETTTIRNGTTSDANDSTGNPIANGFAITILIQGLGDYFNTLQMLSGNNLFVKLNALAQKLDTDPGVVQTDYQAAIASYSGTGSTITPGNPTIINMIGHQLQTGRLITITGSTTTPSINGAHVITTINANSFSIPVTTTAGNMGNIALASAAPFAILASAAITGSTGAGSVVTGDIGIYPNTMTSITNFPPSTVIGTIHANDATAQQALIDATAAFVAINALASGATAISSNLNQTLIPGNYKEASGTFHLDCGSTLTLNGAGTYNFIAASTLVTGATVGAQPMFAFIGGATPSNTVINWAVGSSATINTAVTSAGATFYGNVIAQASVTATQAGTINGRLIALVGGVTLSNTNVVNVPAFSIANWTAGSTTFAEAQGAFNTIVNKLNIDTGVTYQNYLLSEDTKEFEVLIIGKSLNTTDVEMQFSMPFLEGPITVYKGITVNVQYTPEHFGDTSVMKQVPEGTFIFEDNNFSRASVGYKTDLSPGFEMIDFTKSGKGDWGYFIFGEHNWGGGFSGVPLRTYIPRQKQRCRYIQSQFIHDSARERFALYGHSYTFRGISEKAYRA